MHGEGGHHVVDPAGPLCYCGARGCLEILVSGPAIAKLAQKKAAEAVAAERRESVGGNPAYVDARAVSAAARSGDSLAGAVLEHVAFYVGIGLLNMITFFVPEVIVLGGSIMKDYDLFEPTIRTYLNQCSVLVPASSVQIAMAQLGDRAGVFGAAYAILQDLE
jgi:glucokinase